MEEGAELALVLWRRALLLHAGYPPPPSSPTAVSSPTLLLAEPKGSEEPELRVDVGGFKIEHIEALLARKTVGLKPGPRKD